MNFMAKGSSQGFYGEDQNQNQIMISNSTRGNLPFYSSSSTTSSSSSSTQPHKNLVPLTFHQQQNQHHQHQHQPQRGSWLEPQQPSAEEMTSMRCYTGGAGMGMEHMDASPAASGGPYSYNYNSVVNPCSSSVIYLRSAAGAASAPQQAGMVQLQSGFGGGGGGNSESEVEPMVFESVPVVHGQAAAKRLRLFGVNMDCPMSESDQECDILSSTTVPHPHATMASHLSSSPIQHPLQLRLYSGSPLPPLHTTDSDSSDLLDKGKSSDMSFDFDF
ncbi:hypothetical protein CsSME_00007814 [Camellia sinensis var. sinensis]